MNGQVLSVRQITDRIKLLLEQRFPYVWVQGEVTDLTRPGSGHVYFSLKDGDAQLSCVWFRNRHRAQEAVDPLTGEVFEEKRPSLAQTLRNGQKILVAGQISVYSARGGYQLVVDQAQETGDGLLFQALEELKRTLMAEGLFDPGRKRPLPSHPVRIAIVTSPTGAAIRDFLRLAGERGTGSHMRIYPALVQGEGAPASLVQAVSLACSDTWPGGLLAEVLVLIRGGGSLQDLWAFNDADLARALCRSPVPVLTGVGHEIDTCIADLAADVRAATPSHAAQLLWPERHWFAQRLDDLETALLRRFTRHAARRAEALAMLERGLSWLSPANRLERHSILRQDLSARLEGAMSQYLTRRQNHAERLSHALHGLGPVLGRTGSASLDTATLRLRSAGDRMLSDFERRNAATEANLTRLDPEGPLRRGYALLTDSRGTSIRSVSVLRPEDRVEARLVDGRVRATVLGVHRHDPCHTDPNPAE